MPDCEFFHAADPTEVGKKIIAKVRTDLKGCRVEYIFRTEPKSVKGRKALATAEVVSGLKSALTQLHDFPDGISTTGESFFLIQVWYGAWQRLTLSQREALMDHELAHCKLKYKDDTDEEPAYTTVGHDLEEFHAIARRHGAWMPDMTDFVKAIEDFEQGQPPLLQVAN